MVRFLEKNEYAATLPLFIASFGEDEEFIGEYYGDIQKDGTCAGRIHRNRIAVLEEAGQILSMVQIQFESVKDKDIIYRIPYIMGVCTDARYRHRGYMDRVMQYVIDTLREEKFPWCFLIAVNKDIYRHLGFTFDWKLSEQECIKLYADDGLDTASALSLTDKDFYGTETFTLLL